MALVSPSELGSMLDRPELVVVDCRFSLADPDSGRRAYVSGHIPGAVYAHLDEDLSGPVTPGNTGRHPLPEPATLAKRLGTWGIGPSSRVVAYDDAGGAIAARLWFLLRWLGHDRARVLDGGYSAWLAEGLPTSTEVPVPAPATFVPEIRPELVVDAGAVRAQCLEGDHVLLDARAQERYRGEQEPIDPVAGHIPGARSLPFGCLLSEGRFLAPAAIEERFGRVLGGAPPERTVVYCGSGVTACHLLVAANAAGLDGMRLYAGSWSDWITDGTRPIETGGMKLLDPGA